MKISSEQNMKDIFTNKVMSANLGKGLHETVFGSSIIRNATANMLKVVDISLTSSQGVRIGVLDILSKFKSDDKIEDLCYCTVEFIVSGLSLHDDSDISDTKYRNVRMSTGNKLRGQILELEDTPDNTAIAVQIIELGLQALSEYIDVELVNKAKSQLKYRLKPDYRDKIIGELKLRSESGYYALPTTVKPIDWTVDIIDGKVKVKGGYDGLKREIIRGGKIDMPSNSFSPEFLVNNKEPLEALNLIQGIAFRVNKANLKRIKSDLMRTPLKPKPSKEVKASKVERYNFFQLYPTKEDRDAASVDIPEIPEHVLEFDSELAKYKTNIGKITAAKLAIDIAEMYKDEERIYFPHNFDYRGRIYPIPSTLTPQGDDIAKGLLEFADAVELTEDGVEVCFSYLASVYGYDKESYDRRVQLGKEIFSNPDISYKDAEEPYIFTQVFDTLTQVMDGDGMQSRLCVAIDGSCNGLQHMAAITMDKDGGSYVNVGSGDSRQDIYIEIANHSAKLIADDIVNENYITDKDVDLLHILHDIMTGSKARKIAKRPVMINPYGGTFMGYKDYVLQALQEYYPKHSTNGNASTLTKYINRAMKEKLNGGTLYQDWIRKTFSGVAKLGIPPKFETPDGFVVCNFSYETQLDQKHMSSIVSRNGKSIIRVTKRLDELNSRKIGTRAQPNVIHSLDACHLRMVAVEAVSQGINNLWFIHDSFGTDPNNFAKINKITREKFVELYDPKSDRHPIKCIVNKLSGQLDEAGLDYIFNDFPMFSGDKRLNLKEVINNQYFFA